MEDDAENRRRAPGGGYVVRHFSRQMNVRQFGAIFAGAQKNLGQSGATV